MKQIYIRIVIEAILRYYNDTIPIKVVVILNVMESASGSHYCRAIVMHF